MKINVSLLHGLSWTATKSNLQMKTFMKYGKCIVLQSQCSVSEVAEGQMKFCWHITLTWFGTKGDQNHEWSVSWQQRYTKLHLHRQVFPDRYYHALSAHRLFSLIFRILVYSQKTHKSLLCLVLLIQFCILKKSQGGKLGLIWQVHSHETITFQQARGSKFITIQVN